MSFFSIFLFFTEIFTELDLRLMEAVYRFSRSPPISTVTRVNEGQASVPVGEGKVGASQGGDRSGLGRPACRGWPGAGGGQESSDGHLQPVGGVGPVGVAGRQAGVERHRDYVCCICQYSTYRKENLTRHQKNKHEEIQTAAVESDYSCDQCEYQSNFKPNITRHKNTKHKNSLTNEKSVEFYFCSQCDYNTTFKQNLKRHLKSHDKLETEYGDETEPIGQVYTCDECGFTTTRKCKLKTHSHSRTN